jgi:putative serine protease PepD
MTALPPPLPPPPLGARPSDAPRLPRSPSWPKLLAVLLAVAAAAGGGVLIGAQIVDDDESNVYRGPSAEPVEVAAPREPIEQRADVAGIAAAVGPSVVTISADVSEGDVEGVAVGTGVVVTTDGEIITNAHVVEGATKIRVRLAGETEPRTAHLLAADAGNDLALLRIEATELSRATFADPTSVHLGDDVVAIGFALALDGEPSVTSGIVSATERTIITPGGNALDGLIQTDAAISSGNSGGPLVNAAGEVIGINTAVFRNDDTTAATNIGLAISVSEALPVIEQLRDRAGGAERQEGYLGVALADRRDGGQGALVSEVEAGTPASEAGVKSGDIVVAVDSATVDGSAGLIAAVRDRQPGDRVSVVILRDGQRRTIDVTLTDRPEPDN